MCLCYNIRNNNYDMEEFILTYTYISKGKFALVRSRNLKYNAIEMPLLRLALSVSARVNCILSKTGSMVVERITLAIDIVRSKFYHIRKQLGFVSD